MSNRPANLCKLSTGKLIDTHKGFVATFNWLVDWVANFKCDKDTGLKLDTKISDHPKIVNDAESSIEEVEIVVPPIEYDIQTHSLNYKVKKAKILVVDGSEEDRTAFTAVPAYDD